MPMHATGYAATGGPKEGAARRRIIACAVPRYGAAKSWFNAHTMLTETRPVWWKCLLITIVVGTKFPRNAR